MAKYLVEERCCHRTEGNTAGVVVVVMILPGRVRVNVDAALLLRICVVAKNRIGYEKVETNCWLGWNGDNNNNNMNDDITTGSSSRTNSEDARCQINKNMMTDYFVLFLCLCGCVVFAEPVTGMRFVI